MVSHNVAVGVYARGSIVQFSGLMNLGRGWRANHMGRLAKGSKHHRRFVPDPAWPV
jgi:hypothetical protein